MDMRQRDREMGELRFEKRAILKKHNRIAEIREASGREVRVESHQTSSETKALHLFLLATHVKRVFSGA